MKFGKAPIVEAIIDIRVAPRPDASAAEIAVGFSEVAEEFPLREETPAERRIEFRFGPEGVGPVNAGPILGGFRYTDATKRQIVQASRENFVFSLLPPYDRWEDFCGRARPLWERYRDTWRPLQITRVAVRYVNQFVLPLEKDARFWGDNFTILPGSFREEILPGPQALGDFHLNMVLPQADIEAWGIVNFGTLPTKNLKEISVVLDIDVFRENLALEPTDDRTLWMILETLRHRKNDLFRASLTKEREEALEPLEENP